jgi:glycosyltransferase involved in cell wall biosynthesis
MRLGYHLLFRSIFPMPTSRPRILYLQPSLVPPPKDAARDRFFQLSDVLEGDIVQALWFRTPAEVEEHFGPGSYPILTRGSFRYHFLLLGLDLTAQDKLKTFWFFIQTTLSLHRHRPFDCLIAYSHLTTALIGVFLKCITFSPLCIEIATSPHLVYITERPKPTWQERLRKFYSDCMLHLTVWCSNCVHLLYPEQLDVYPLLRKVTTESFHEFVPTSFVDRQPPAAEHYILQVSPLFPDLKLKIQGYFPDLADYTPSGGFPPNIEILKAAPNEQILARIGQAKVLVLASRCEGMGRVVIEAMGAGVPVIGAAVGGIPSLVQHEVNGLLFPSGDAQALAKCLEQLLSDNPMRQRLGEAAFSFIHSHKNEAVYIKAFRSMVDKAIAS